MEHPNTSQGFSRIVRPDKKNRITLGSCAKNVSSYVLTEQSDGRILLEPRCEIPASEKWLWENKIALTAVKKGLIDSAEGKRRCIGSFAQYADEEIE